MALSDGDLKRLKEKHSERITVSCDDFHAHSTDCLEGPEDSIDILRLVDDLVWTREAIRKLARHES